MRVVTRTSSIVAPIVLVLMLSAVGCSDSDPMQIASDLIISVEQAGGGDFTSIQEAIDSATTGALIQIGAGTYQGRLMVDKNITITGSGASTILQVQGAALSFPDESLDNSEAILEIRNTSGVTVSGVHFSGTQDGVLIRNSSDITLIDINASNNGDDGVDVRNSQNVTISGTFSGNGDKGVQIREGSSNVTVQASQIQGNVDRGVRVRDSFNCSVLNSTIADNGQDGVEVRDSTGVQVLGNSMMGNAGWGLRIRNSADTIQSNNTYVENQSGEVKLE